MDVLGVGSNGQHDGSERAGTKCCVCLEEVDYRGTALIQCGRCKMDVHVKCYGVSVPTNGSVWLCEPCEYMETPTVVSDKPKMQPYCIVCPTDGGALRRTSQANVWCHVLCMNWIPELSHSLSGEMNEVLDIRLLDRSRQSLKCHICGLKGGCIQCISGRCAKPFHVMCAMRVPSDTVFTGYNNENQQVYHCKTHLSDIATFKYEMVDTSWKKSPLIAKFLASTPQVKSKCRVCSAKVPPHHLARHEVLCLVGWLAKEEARIRRIKMEELGLTPVVIDYGKKVGEKRSETTPGKNRKNLPQIRPCPQCGEQIRETLMMGHMKNNCKMSRHSAKRAKNPAALNRQRNSHDSSAIDIPQEEPSSLAIDLSDVLFATWPGQAAGSLLDSTSFWRILNNNFFSTKILLKKRMEPLCKNLCGARLEDMGDFSKKTSAHDSIMCSDTVLFGREEDATETLSLTSIIHRCDFMMRGSRMRCVDDLFTKPLVRLSHSETSSSKCETPNGSAHEHMDQDGDARNVIVQFKNTEGDCVSCKYGFRMNNVDAANDSGHVWSRYNPDGLSAIVGGGLEDSKKKLEGEGKLWIALQEMQDVSSPTNETERDEITPEVSLLVERLREQMRQNRYRVRSLCRRTQAQDFQEESATRERTVVEAYFKEYSLWKTLSKTLLVGYREFWKRVPVDEAEKTDEKDAKGEAEVGEEPDDGTCVVCFDGTSPESNPIIFCDRCDLAVHQRCYGIPHVPSNEFYCDRCRLEDDGRDPATEVYCQLCPLRDGAFKRTVDGKWVHVVCALWCPGVWIGNLQTLSDIKLVDSAHRTRFVDTIQEVKALIAPQSQDAVAVAKRVVRTKCIEHGSLCRYCRVTCGRTIKCCHAGCTESFHPLCAWFEGNPMIVKLDATNGYIYSGGGSGLVFTMLCGQHLPDDYTPELRAAQSKNRRRFRIDSFFRSQSKVQPVPMRALGGAGTRGNEARESGTDVTSIDAWTDRELCAACFDYPSPVSQDTQDHSQLNKRQLMMRCQYCSIFIHAACCLSEIDDVSDLFRSNWICERCTLVGQGKKASAAGCVICDGTSDYLMPCVGASATTNGTTPQSGGVASQASESVSSASGERWVHVLCAKMIKTKIFKRNHMLCAAQPQLQVESHGRCDLCQTRGRNLAGCGNCSKKFHATCAARKKFYVSRVAKSDWRFYCPTHPPADVAYDAKRQAWFTGEILAHLHELRHVLERGRMIVEMARQRDRQKKRLLNLCSIQKMELSMEMILKKRPTPVMKDIYQQYTGDAMEDVPRRQIPAPSRTAKTISRARGNDGDEKEDADLRRSTRRPVDTIANDDVNETPRKRRRLGDEVEVTPIRRSSRRGTEAAEDGDDSLANNTKAVRTVSRSAAGTEPSRRRNRTLAFVPDEFDYRTLANKLLRVTRDSDFDNVVEEAYPELVTST